MADDTYNGWTNRETWAWFLHMTNDAGLESMLREWTEEVIRNEDDPADLRIGEHIRDRFEELEDEEIRSLNDMTGQSWEFTVYPDWLDMLCRDVGSFWRIDWDEIGSAARELVGES